MPFADSLQANLIFPAKLTYNRLSLSVDGELRWPLEQAASGTDVFADLMDVSSASDLFLYMPSAIQGATGASTIVTNVGSYNVTVKTFSGNTLVQVQPGQSWIIWLTDNTSQNGTWRSTQLGATLAVGQASALAGPGLAADGGLLEIDIPIFAANAGPNTLTDSDRGSLFLWTGGANNLIVPSIKGWMCYVRNAGSGDLTIAADTGDIDDAATKILPAGSSCIIIGTNTLLKVYTITGGGSSSGATFDYVSISVAGTGNYTLSGSNLNRIAYKFTGVLTGNRTVIVPGSVAAYWVDNSTTGAFSLYIKTAPQAAPGVEVLQNNRAILYCDGTDVIDADTTTTSYPIAVALGGTGAASAATARTNLGSTTVGDAVFTAATAAVGRTALGATVIGSAVFTAAAASDARTAISAASLAGNTFTGTQVIEGTAPALIFSETDAAVDSKLWYFVADSGAMSFRLRNDAATLEHNLLVVARSGITPGALQFGSPELQLNYASPAVLLNDNSAAANNRKWKIRNIGEALYISSYSDDETTGANAMWVERTGVTIDRVYFQASDVIMAANLRFSNDATEYRTMASFTAGPEIRSKWNSSTTDRYMKIGFRDNLDNFTPLQTIQDSAITFNVWPTIDGVKIDHGAGVVKATDSSKVSTITPATDSELLVTCPAGRYIVEGLLIFDAPVAGTQGFQFTINHSASAVTLYYQFEGHVNGADVTTRSTSGIAVATQGTTVQFPTISTTTYGNAVRLRGSAVSVGGGTLDVKWSQNSSSANGTFLRSGSYIKLTRVL